MDKAIVETPHPSTYMLDILNDSFVHMNNKGIVSINLCKDELEYLIECVKEKEANSELIVRSESLVDIDDVKALTFVPNAAREAAGLKPIINTNQKNKEE